VSSIAFAARAARAQDPLAAQLARVDSLLTAQYPSSQPSAVVAVVRNGALVFVAAHGMADHEEQAPMQPETLFNVMSVSKQFTAASIALLARRGARSSNDDVRR
jgi:CubicO group peptidase (beta-lactamase class C family)